MENIPMQHRRLYNDAQLEQLCTLIELLHDQPLFICDVDPEVDVLSPYFKPEEYPLWSGGKDNFSIGVDEVKKFLFLSFLTYTSTRLLGQLKWVFREDVINSLTLTLYEQKGNKYLEAAEQIASLLGEKFSGCNITVTIDNINNAAA